MGEYRLKLRAELGQLKTDLIAAEGLASRSVKEIKKMIKSGLDLKVNLDSAQLAHNTSILRNWTEQQNLSVDVGVRLVGLEQATLEVNQLQQRLNTHLQLGIDVELVGLDRIQRDLSRLRQSLSDPLRIEVDDRRLTDLNAHFALKARHYGELSRLFRDNPLTVRVNDSELVNIVNRPNNTKIKVDLESSRVDSDIDRVVKKLDNLKPKHNLLRAVTFAPTQVATGFFQGIGQTISKDFGSGYTQGIQSALGDTIGSSGLLGRKMAEAMANRARNAIVQLVPTAVLDGVRTAINESLGEADVYIESRSRQGKKSKQQRKNKELAREGIAEERRTAAREVEDRGHEVSAYQAEYKRLEQLYQSNLRAKTVVDKKIESHPEGSRSKAELEALSASFDFDLNAITEEQIRIGKKLRSSRAAHEQAERRVERSDDVYQALKPTQLPKLYRDAIAGVPEHLIPELIADPTLAQRGADGTYSTKLNRLKVTPEIYKSIQNGSMSKHDFEIMYHELQHAKDFKFGQFQGLLDRANLEVSQPLEATAQELKDIAPYLSQYRPEARAVEQNAIISGRRASEKAFEKQKQRVLASQVTNAYGLAGLKLDRIVNNETSETISRAVKVEKLSTNLGINSPSAGKIIDRANILRDRQEQIGLDVAKASSGELSSDEIESLQVRIDRQILGVEHISQRIEALKRSLIKRIEAAKQQVPSVSSKYADIADPWSAQPLEYTAQKLQISEPHLIEISANSTTKPVSNTSSSVNPDGVKIKPEKLELKSPSELTEAEAIARAKSIAQKFATSSKEIKEAIKKGETQLAFEMGNQIEHYAEIAQNEIASITSILGEKAAFGTTLGSQLANAKGQITRARNSGSRAVEVFKNSQKSDPLLGDELASLRAPGDRSALNKLIEGFKSLFGGRSTSSTPPTEKPLGRPIPPPDSTNSTPPINKPLGSPAAPPDRIISEREARSFNVQDLVTSIQKRLGFFDGVYPQAERQVAGSEKRGRKNVKAFVRDMEKHQDRFDAGFKRVDRESAKGFYQQLEETTHAVYSVFGDDGSINPIRPKATGLKEDFDDLAKSALSLVGVFGGFMALGYVSNFLSKVATGAILAAAKFEDLKLAAGAATSSKFAADALVARSTAQANQLGYNYQEAIAADASFAAATKGTALELVSGNISTSLRQYNRVMGVDENRQKLAQTAVQQMAGKGTLAAEEVFGQLAESSPGAVNVLARSQGLTIGQLRAKMAEGGLNAADTLSKFGQQLNAESINQVGAASETASAKIGKLQNSLLALQTAGGEKLLAPAGMGLGVVNGAIELLTHNIDTLAKVGTAGFIALTIGGISLAAKLLPVQTGFSGIQSIVNAALPSLLKFAGQAALAYAGIELLSFVFNSFQNKSPLKGMAEEMEALAAKTSGSVAQIKESLDKLKETKYSKDRGIIGTARDVIQGALQRAGVNTTTTIQDRENEDILTADRLLTATQTTLNNKPDLKIATTIKERESLAQELSILRAQRATLTSRDRNKLEANASREQQIIKRQGELDFPISERQAQLEGTIKSNRAIAEDLTLPDSARSSARSIIKDAEIQQRLLQAELSRTSDKVQDLSLGLRNLTFGLSSTIQSIEQTGQLQNAQIYSSASTDPRNVGALQGSQSTREIGELGAKRAAYQQDLKNYQSVFAQNQPTLSALGINPDKTSKEQLDYLTKTASDPQSQQILSYVQQYQQVKQQFLQSNQQLFQSQYSYLKAIADYNKGLADQLRNLQQSLVTQSIQARNQIAGLQEGVENQRLEVDKTSLAAFRQRQQNSLNSAYNSFLEKLGIAQDSLFGDIFGSFDRVLESFEKIRANRLTDKGDAIGQHYKEIGNANKSNQAQTEEYYRVQELQRQNRENQLNNPGQRVEGQNTSYTTQPYTIYSGGKSIDRADQINEHHDGKAYQRQGRDKYRSDGGVNRIVKDIVLADAQGRQNVPVPSGISGLLNMVPDAQSGGYGNMAEIRDAQNQVIGRFAHLKSFNPSLQQGQQIDYGQILGIQGSTGKSTGTHLHYELPEGLNSKYIADLKSGDFSTNSATYKPVPKVSPLPKVGSKPGIFNEITPSAIAMIKEHEGFHRTAYRDTDGVPTIGHGTRVLPFRNRAVKMGDTIAQPEADAALAIELQEAKEIIAKNIRVPLNKNQLSALVSFTFNGGEKMLQGEMANTINQGDFAGAAKLFPKFNKAMVGGKLQPLAGLTTRRNAEAAMFATPSNDSTVSGSSGSASTSTAPNYVASPSLQGEVDAQINASSTQGQKILTEQKRQYQADTQAGRDRVRQNRSLRNQQDEAERIKAEKERLQLRNSLDRNLPEFRRKSDQITGQVASQAYAATFTVSPLDRAIEQYGGIGSRRTVRDEVVAARSQSQQILADNTRRRIDTLNQINQLIAAGKGWAELKKEIQADIVNYERNGDTQTADTLKLMVKDTDAQIGTPKARQQQIARLSAAYKNQFSPGQEILASVSNNLSETSTKLLTLNQQYLPKTAESVIESEARALLEQYDNLSKTVTGEIVALDDAIKQLTIDFAAEKDPIKKQKLSDDLATAQLNRDLKLKERAQLDDDGLKAANKLTRDRRTTDEIAIDRASADFYEQQHPGNLYTAIQVDKARLGAGQRELGMQLGSIGQERYNLEMEKLKYSTDTYRKSVEGLRPAVNGLFSDIGNGANVFEATGAAITSFLANIAKKFEDMIMQHLGDQLMDSLLRGAGDIKKGADDGDRGLLPSLYRGASQLLGFGDPSPLAAFGPQFQPYATGGTISGGFRTFATGGVVKTPTLGLIGEGAYNEAVVPLPDGKSIPVVMPQGQGGNGGGDINSHVSVTVNNNGNSQETSAGAASQLNNMVKSAVLEVLSRERRAGGLAY